MLECIEFCCVGAGFKMLKSAVIKCSIGNLNMCWFEDSRLLKMEELFMIRDLQEQGMSISEKYSFD